MKRLAALAALLAAGCGGTGADLPQGADESYQRWREGVERVCQRLRERVDDLPDPSDEAGDGSDAEKLRALGRATRPIAALYLDAARQTRAVPRPQARVDRVKEYVEAFERRARNYDRLGRTALSGDRRATSELTDRDETLLNQLALATENAAVRC